MKITITTASVLVDDQERALAFYTEILGFVKKTDLPAGEFRWLTVVGPDAENGSSCCSSLTSIPQRKSSRLPWSKTAFPTQASELRMRELSTSDSSGWA